MKSISKLLLTSPCRHIVSLNYSKQSNLKLNHLLKTMQNDKSQNKSKQKDKNKDKIKERVIRNAVNKIAPGTVNLQILGSGAPGSPASVYLFADQSRYLFNCGEGTQRLAYEHKIKLSRLEQIFITSRTWNRIGGLPGLCLTIQDAGVSTLNLNGPPEMDSLFTAMRRFVILKDLSVTATAGATGYEFEDAVMKVTFINLMRESSSEMNDKKGNFEFEDNTNYYPDEEVGKNNTQKEKSRTFMRSAEVDNYVVSYICKLKPRPGALSLEKCVDKGVPPGPLLGQLKNGVDITLADGTIVKSKEVRGPDDPGPVFIFIDIPTEEYLKSLESSNNYFAPYQSTTRNENDLALTVIHFTPQNIVNTSIYQKFIAQFAPSTKHLILNDSNRFSGYASAHRLQWQLNQLNPEIFPILNENACLSYPEDPIESLEKKMKLDDENLNMKIEGDDLVKNDFGEYVSPITYFHLRPRKGLDKSQVVLLTPNEYLKETEIISGFSDSLRTLKEHYSRIQASSDITEYPKILFLGTGSCMPNKTRNVSAILIHINEDTCILFDCGEGTAGQIIRFYGVEKAEEVFKKLKAIYISHLHADHHIGLIGLLQQRRRLLGEQDEKLILFAPIQISSWLKFYDSFIENISDSYELIPNDELMSIGVANDILERLCLEDISTCLVRHCPHSFGVAIQSKNSNNELIKITYSGDTMPCDDLVELGKNSTVLIHEATMEDDLVDEAKIKMHSTVSQALEQGFKMEAKYILLTHFSQRYAKLPRLESSLETNVGIAFDNMEVTLSDLPHLHLLYPPLRLMFTEHCEEMEQKSIKRANKLQRQNMLLNS